VAEKNFLVSAFVGGGRVSLPRSYPWVWPWVTCRFEEFNSEGGSSVAVGLSLDKMDEEENKWGCEACTFLNRDGASACEICGTPNPRVSSTGPGGDGNAAGDAPGYWSCKACTMQNPLGAFACHLCHTVDEDQRSKVRASGDGAGDNGLSPALLDRLAKDRHYSLQDYLTKLCHNLALAAAEAEQGISRQSIDKAYIPILLGLMSNPSRIGGPDVPLQACRAVNYFLQIGAGSEVGAQRGMRIYALCITCAAAAASAEYQELGQEAVSGVDLLCRISPEYVKELAETDIGEGGVRVLASFVKAVYRTSPNRHSKTSSSPVGAGVGGAMVRGSSIDDDGGGNWNSGGGAGAGAEAAVGKAMGLLIPLLNYRTASSRTSSAASAAAAAAVAAGVSTTGGGGGIGGGGAGVGTEDDLEAVVGALLAALRRGSIANREAALSALGSKVLPRLGAPGSRAWVALGGPEREWLGELVTDEGLLVAAIADRSPQGASCHVWALMLAYRLLASSPELMSLALQPSCPLLPAVLGALGRGGSRASGRGSGACGGGGGGGAGGDAAGAAVAHRRRDSVSSTGSATSPSTPRLGPRTPRSGKKQSVEGQGLLGEGDAAGRSGLAALRIVGLVS
ncbi:unnamed protein product, partial [Discosporangium mesarthrocarpum]